MTNNVNELVWHDGALMKAQNLVGMAKMAGSYALAEHYLVSLLAHGVAHGLNGYIDMVNEVRAHYLVEPFPEAQHEELYETNDDSEQQEELARECFRAMNEKEHQSLLRACLTSLSTHYPRLFQHKKNWLGIYLVWKDRLDGGMKQCEFLTLAKRSLPSQWSETLCITESVFKNMRRDFPEDEVYYEMRHNPQETLCDTFWDIVKSQLLRME